MLGRSSGSSLASGTRPYQIAIVLMLIVFAWYVVVTQQRLYELEPDSSSHTERRLYPVGTVGGGMNIVPQAPACNCNCMCNGVASDDNASASSRALITSPSTSAAASPAAAGASCPDTNGRSSALVSKDQQYGSLPAIDSDSHMQFVRATYPPVGPETGSILDKAYLKTPVAYGTHFVPSESTFDPTFPESGFLQRPACQRDTDILQNYIYKNQHPEDCKTKKLFVRRHMPGYGLFAGLGLSSNYLFLAAVTGRTLIDLSPNTYFTGNCPSNGLDCAFLPVSSCTAADFNEGEICYDTHCMDSARVISIDRMSLNDFLPCAPTEFPVQRCQGPPIHRSLNDILPEMGPHGEQFFQQEFTRYLTRPNKKLQEYTAEQMKALKITDELISVHVRHGDKQEGIQFPTRAYSLIVKRVIQITGIKTVFIGSDDTSVYEELPKWVELPNVRYVWLDHTLNPIVFSANEAGRKGSNTIGLNLMAQTIIFTQSQAYIGTRSSNAGQVVYAMQGNDCSRQKIAYDMYGDLFYNSWYCRGDIVHAGREWMCALQKPGQGSLIWQWGGAKTEC